MSEESSTAAVPSPRTKLLVLDLDETLVYGSKRESDRGGATRVGPYFVYRRPGVEEFMAWAFDYFGEVAVWTAGSAPYAQGVVHDVLGCAERLAFLWSQRRCTYRIDHDTYEYVCLKDIRKLRRAGYRKSQIIAVDNTPSKWARSYGNLVAVSDWEGDPADRELRDLRTYLTWLGCVENVRRIEKRWWRDEFGS